MNPHVIATLSAALRWYCFPSAGFDRGPTALAALGIATPPGINLSGVDIAPLVLALGYVAAIAWFRRVPRIGVASPTPTPFREPQR